MGSYSRRKYSQWAPYVPVAERRKKALTHIKSITKDGTALNPVVIEGRTIAKTFWGKAWCENLESYSDFENRLPRGRTYVRNGSVIDLQITKGHVHAKVMGSSLYRVTIQILPMAQGKWDALVKTCAGKIDSLIELLQGKFSDAVMKVLSNQQNGLFPKPHEIEMSCSCPDYAGMCKHIAATLYGVGAALDSQPERLFDLRHVNHLDLVSSVGTGDALTTTHVAVTGIEEKELSSLFGIEIDSGTPTPPKKAVTKKPAKPRTTTSPTIRKPPQKKSSSVTSSVVAPDVSSADSPGKRRSVAIKSTPKKAIQAKKSSTTPQKPKKTLKKS
jgi:uncharacterized Zn finger protein